MKHGWFVGLTTVFVGVAAIATMSAQDPGISLIGIGSIPGDALDKSGPGAQADLSDG